MCLRIYANPMPLYHMIKHRPSGKSANRPGRRHRECGNSSQDGSRLGSLRRRARRITYRMSKRGAPSCAHTYPPAPQMHEHSNTAYTQRTDIRARFTDSSITNLHRIHCRSRSRYARTGVDPPRTSQGEDIHTDDPRAPRHPLARIQPHPTTPASHRVRSRMDPTQEVRAETNARAHPAPAPTMLDTIHPTSIEGKDGCGGRLKLPILQGLSGKTRVGREREIRRAERKGRRREERKGGVTHPARKNAPICKEIERRAVKYESALMLYRRGGRGKERKQEPTALDWMREGGESREEHRKGGRKEGGGRSSPIKEDWGPHSSRYPSRSRKMPHRWDDVLLMRSKYNA
ncbi:hypothetical protein B0H13DRAFT_1894645 [Mycena leptocephala]|nr:hypothetical protein B0H13DRAFT_1894645 [Mycena leptocephala]